MQGVTPFFSSDEIGEMKEEDNTRADFVIYTQKSSD